MDQPLLRLILGSVLMTYSSLVLWLGYRRWIAHAGSRTRSEAAFERLRTALPLHIPDLRWYARLGAIASVAMFVAGLVLAISSTV